MKTCRHCGQRCGDYQGGCAWITGADGQTVWLCHPNDPARPDCYRRVTVYREPLGALKVLDVRPAGVDGLVLV